MKYVFGPSCQDGSVNQHSWIKYKMVVIAL